MGRLRLVAPPQRRRGRRAGAACLARRPRGCRRCRAASPPRPQARAWLVVNPITGQVLPAHDATARMPIASITKLMPLIVVLGRLRLDQIVRVDPRAAAVGHESVYLTPDGEIQRR